MIRRAKPDELCSVGPRVARQYVYACIYVYYVYTASPSQLNPDLREQIRELRGDWNDAVRRWSVNRTCELGSAEHRRQMEPMNNGVADKLDILLGFHIPRDDLLLAFTEALRAPSRSRSRSRSRWQHPGVHKYALEEA